MGGDEEEEGRRRKGEDVERPLPEATTVADNRGGGEANPRRVAPGVQIYVKIEVMDLNSQLCLTLLSVMAQMNEMT